jgi:hypothetical protein
MDPEVALVISPRNFPIGGSSDAEEFGEFSWV